jgi:hypothetical protein
MTLPNFLVIGAAKSGTTSLHYYLQQHPQVYMSRQKETNFFAFEGERVEFYGPGDDELCRSAITDLRAYEEQFAAIPRENVAVGEASAWYLYSDKAAANIRRHVPNAKLIAMLRHPVERALSSYLHVVREGRESLAFEESLSCEEERIARGWEFIWHFQRAGLYAEQVERFLTLFPREQMRFYLYEDFLSNAAGVLADAYAFLGVDPSFVANTSVRYNVTGVPRNRLLGRLVLRPNPVKSMAKTLLPAGPRYRLGQRLRRRVLSKPAMNPETRRTLMSRYREDITALEPLIGKSLSQWNA